MGYRIEELKHQIAECEMSDLNYTEESIETLLNFLNSKDIATLEMNFEKIDKIARGLYPDVKEEEFEIKKEAREVSRDTVQEVTEIPETYESVGKLTERLSKRKVVEALPVNGKMEEVSNFFKENRGN